MSKEDVERIFAEILRSRSRDLAEAVLRAIESNEDLALRLAKTIAKTLAVPLNVATKEDLKALESSLRTEISSLRAEVSKIDRRLRRVERTLENMTISIEEEARIVVERLLKERGLSISLSSLVLDRRYEFDFYGAGDSLIIVGEAKTRASEETLDRLLRRVERARDRWPEKFKGKIVVTLYCLRYIGDPKKAEEKGVWLVESTRELTKAPIR